MKLTNVIKYIKNRKYRFFVNFKRGFLDNMPDEKFIKKQYLVYTGRKLNLKNPLRFNEKLQWLKLYNRKDIFTCMVDKYLVKDYLKEVIGEEYIVPLIGVWESTSDIDFDSLPEKFVLKTTHGSGGVYVCRDKSKFNKDEVFEKIENDLKTNYYYSCREWPYKNVKPRIIAEKYLQDGDSETLNVFKIFNFSGEPRIIQTIQNDKTENETIDYFDVDWNLLDMRQNFPNSEKHLARPNSLEEMLGLSRKCSREFPFLRTDWYEVNGQVYFSEFTFFSDAGLASFYPDKWDYELGDWINLEMIKRTKEA